VRVRKRAAAALTALLLTAGLTGCSGVDALDAKVYVDGLLRECYLGETTQDYMDMVEIGEKDVASAYEDTMEQAAQDFLRYYAVEEPSKELRSEVVDLCKEIYSHAAFEVTSAARQEDGSFSVKVSVEPIDIVRLADEAWEEAMAEFLPQEPPEEEEEQGEEATVAETYADALLELYRSLLPETGNLEPVSLTVQLEQDEEGRYALTQEDFARLDREILDYELD